MSDGGRKQSNQSTYKLQSSHDFESAENFFYTNLMKFTKLLLKVFFMFLVHLQKLPERSRVSLKKANFCQSVIFHSCFWTKATKKHKIKSVSCKVFIILGSINL